MFEAEISLRPVYTHVGLWHIEKELDPVLATLDEIIHEAFDNAIDTLVQQGCIDEREENLPGRHTSRAYRLTPKGVAMIRELGV